MADNQEMVSDNDASDGGGILSMVGSVISGAASVVGSMWNAVMADGTVEAAWRQGADEIGEALKAFPDSIQVSEPGTINNPTQGEIAAAREDDASQIGPPENSDVDRIPHDTYHDYDGGYSM